MYFHAPRVEAAKASVKRGPLLRPTVRSIRRPILTPMTLVRFPTHVAAQGPDRGPARCGWTAPHGIVNTYSSLGPETRGSGYQFLKIPPCYGDHRMAARLSLVLAGLACLNGLPAAAQESSTPLIRSTTQEVLLDVVVRDKKEHLIRNLKPEDIRVLEDGVPQKLKGFRFTDAESVEPQAAAEAPAVNPKSVSIKSTAAPALNPLHHLNLV